MLQELQTSCCDWCHIKLMFIQKITRFHSLQMVASFFLQTLCLPHNVSMSRCVSSLQSWSIYIKHHTHPYTSFEVLSGNCEVVWCTTQTELLPASAMLYLLQQIKMHDNEDAWNTNTLLGCDATLFHRYIPLFWR